MPHAPDPARADVAARSRTRTHRAADAAGAVLRPDVRRRRRPGVDDAAPRARRRATPATRSIAFPIVFFAIWWAWMNFTWFASAYDTDDVAYRLAVFVQMAGVLVFAAGVPARSSRTSTRRSRSSATWSCGSALVAQWLRAAAAHPEGRPCRAALRRRASSCARSGGSCSRSSPTAAGGSCSPSPLAVAELAVPVWAERDAAHAVAPRPHRRALRPVHDHRARRVGARRRRSRVQVALDAGERLGDARHDRRRRPAHRVLDVVDLLRPCRSSTCCSAGPRRRSTRHDGRAVVHLGLRPLLRVRQRGGHRRRPRRRRRPGDATTPSSPTSRPGFTLTVPGRRLRARGVGAALPVARRPGPLRTCGVPVDRGARARVELDARAGRW